MLLNVFSSNIAPHSCVFDLIQLLFLGKKNEYIFLIFRFLKKKSVIGTFCATCTASRCYCCHQNLILHRWVQKSIICSKYFLRLCMIERTMFQNLGTEKALLLSVVISLLLVFCIHFKSSFKHRDTTEKIKERFWRSLVATFLVTCVLLLTAIRCHPNTFNLRSFFEVLGFIPEKNLISFGYVFSALIALFLGNFVLNFIQFNLRIDYLIADVKDDYFSCENGFLQFCRNFVVAPGIEEFIYRCCIVPIMLPVFKWKTVVFAPLLFGFAHIHHAFEMTKLGYDTTSILIKVTIQTVYTTLFGAYSSFLFITYQNFYLVWAVHAFCNVAGLPAFGTVFGCNNWVKTVAFVSLYSVGMGCFGFINVKYIYNPNAI